MYTKPLFKWVSAVALTAAVLLGCPQPTGGGGGSVAVTGISLKIDSGAIANDSQITLWAGEAPSEQHTVQLTAVIEPANASNQAVRWTSIPEAIAEVSATGLVTAKAMGEATITATTVDGEKTAAVRIVALAAGAVETKVDSVSIKIKDGDAIGEEYSMEPSQLELEAVVAPANATNKSVSWSSSNTAVATINGDGVLTAVKAGEATITATTIGRDSAGDSVFASFNLTVIPATNEIKITGVSIKVKDGEVIRDSLPIPNVNATVELEAVVSPEDFADKTVTWATSNAAVATITGGGVLKAIADGTATITVKTTGKQANGQPARASFTVRVGAAGGAVTGVSLTADGAAVSSGSELYLWAGDNASEKHSVQLAAVIVPADAGNQGVAWTSSAPAIAEVSNAGLVTARAVGEATITVTTNDGAKTATVKITVLAAGTVEKKVESVSIKINDSAAGSAYSLGTGATASLAATVLPADATNRSVSWSSSNTAVATINNGVLTAVSAGSATITVTTNGRKADGNAATASFALTVTGSGGSAYIYQWEAGDVTASFTLKSGVDAVKENIGDPAKSWARTSGNISVSNTGIGMPNSGRFSIGSKSTTATTATSYDTNGEFNFTQKAKVTVGYTAFTGSGLQIYVNNNTTSDANSVLTNSAAQLSSKILSGMTGEAASGTITAIIDPANFAQTDDALASLQHAFLGFRCESGGSITITSILIETVPPATDPVTAVTIAPDTDLTIKVGTTASTTLTANITPETDVTYAWTITSGGDMVEFDGVTNKKTAKIKIKTGVTTAGSATVKCVASGPAGSTAQATKTITVALPVFNSVTVSLPAGSSEVIGVNGTINLSAAIDEALLASVFTPTYVWTVTSGSSLATIESGAATASAVIKGNAIGSATIQCAVTINGVTKSGSKDITVSGSIPVTSITISASSATVMAGDGGSNLPQTLQFSKEVLPINATIQTVTWSVKNGSDYTTAGAATAATINGSGLLTAQSASLAADTEVWVFAAANDSSGIVSAGYKVTVKPYADQLIWKWDLATNGAPSIPVRNTAGTLNATNIMVTNNTVTGTASGIEIGSGGRICFGTNQSTATTNSNYVAGSFDFRRPIKITVDYSSGVNSKKFRIWVSNNTSGQNSVLGDPCRIYDGPPATGGGTINAVFDPSTFMASGTDAQKQTLQNAFVCFGVESSGGIVVNSILIEYND